MEVKWREPPLAALKTIGFDLMTSNEIIDSSIFGIHENARGLKSLCDPRLGLPNSEDKCGTCQLANIKEHQCPGHFGHFSLSLPIFNPQHIHILVRVLNLVCPNCGKRKVKGRKRMKQTNVLYNTEEGFFKGADCKYCKNSSEICYPELKFKIVTQKMQDLEVDTIEMHVVRNRGIEFPPDFWSFLDRSTDISEKPRLVRPLLPAEATRILKMIPDDVSRKIGLALRPDCLVIKDFSIPPNCLRFMDGYKLGYSLRRLERNQKTTSLSSILALNKSLKQAYDDLYSAHKDAAELQARFSNYYKSFKIFSSEKEQLVRKRKGFQVRNHKQITRKSGPTWFKTNILGKRSHFSSVGVISGDPNITFQQLAIPWIVAQNLKVSERITKHNLDKLRGYVHLSSSNFFITRDDEKRRMVSRQSLSDLQIGDIIERSLIDGDLVFTNRSPTIHKHSFLGFQAKIDDRFTFGINPILCGPIAGDFDGDMLHVYVPQSLEARAEVSELLDVSRQMICPQGGQALLKLSEDGVLSSYLILQRHFWLNKQEIQMLNMYCDTNVPRPAIVKAPEGGAPLWTGLQVLSMTLPPHIEYTYSTSVLVRESEILQCSVDNKWLTDSHKGMVACVCYQAGPEKAVHFLSSLQSVLHEWLFRTGFSVSLKDLYLTDDLKTRRKLLAEVQTALEDAKESSRKAVGREKQIQRICSGWEEIGTDITSSASDNGVFHLASEGKMVCPCKPKSLEDTAIREYQAVFREIQTTVERHSSSCNPMLAMIKARSKGSLSKLVQQCACLGLHLLKGERWFSSRESVDEAFWEYSGIVGSSFLEGLNSNDFLSHLIATRKSGKGYGVEVPGELFRNCMFGLREVYLAYDGSVRTRAENHVVQFHYEGSEGDFKDNKTELVDAQNLGVGIEAVGALAATAIIEPAYNYTFDQSLPTKTNPIDLLKETLIRGSGTGLKGADFKSILAISSQIARRKSDLARAALEIQNHLQCFTLEMMPLKTMIECNFQKGDSENLFPWITHIHIPQVALRKVNINVSDILSAFSRSHFKRSTDALISSECSQCDKNESCIKVRFDLTEDIEGGVVSSFNNSFFEYLNLVKHSVLPLLLKTVIKGSPKIKSAVVQWKDYEQWSNLFNENVVQISKENQPLGELVVEVSTLRVPRRGQAWEVVKESCCHIVDSIDWRRSRPYSIAEVCFTLGVEAARALIFERLRHCAHQLGRGVYNRHLSLISDYMTHSGKVLPFTSSGMKEWNKMMDISAPFTEGAFQDPRRTYFDAARKRKTERLCGLLASLVWGKCGMMGENNFFDLIWSPQSQEICVKEETPFNVQGRDILDFLSGVDQLEVSNSSARNMTPFLDMDISEHKDTMQMQNKMMDMCPEFPPGFECRYSCYTEDNMEGITKIEDTGEAPAGFGSQSCGNALDIRSEVEDMEMHSTPEEVFPGFGSSNNCFHDTYQKRRKSALNAEDFRLLEDDTREEVKAGTHGSINMSQLTLSIQTILHHRYHDGEELVENDMDFLVRKVLVHHPNSKEKIGPGIAAIKIGHSLEHPESRCFVLRRKDGTFVDFSYHKCLRNIPEG